MKFKLKRNRVYLLTYPNCCEVHIEIITDTHVRIRHNFSSSEWLSHARFMERKPVPIGWNEPRWWRRNVPRYVYDTPSDSIDADDACVIEGTE